MSDEELEEKCKKLAALAVTNPPELVAYEIYRFVRSERDALAEMCDQMFNFLDDLEMELQVYLANNHPKLREKLSNLVIEASLLLKGTKP